MSASARHSYTRSGNNQRVVTYKKGRVQQVVWTRPFWGSLRLAKLEKAEFTRANEYFEGERNDEVALSDGFFTTLDI